MEREFSRSMGNAGEGARQALGGLASLPVGIAGMLYQVWLAGIGIVARAATEAPRIIESLAQDGARVQRATLGLAGRAAGAVGRGVGDTARRGTQRAERSTSGRNGGSASRRSASSTGTGRRRGARAKSNGGGRGRRSAKSQSSARV